MKRAPARIALLLALAGCAGPRTARIASVGDEARANEIAATSKYRGGRLRVTGTVVVTAMHRFEAVSPAGPTLLVVGATSAYVAEGSVETEWHPYVRLVDPGRTDTFLSCYFRPKDVDEAARLARGMTTTLVGQFQEIRGTPEGVEIVLNRCAIE